MRTPDLITPLGATALAAALLFAAPVAQAQTTNIFDESSGFYIGGGLGQAEPDDADDDTLWKVYGGWQLNKWLAAELAYMDFGESDLDNGGKADTWGISAMAVGSIPVPIGALDRLSILGKIGTIYFDQDVSNAPGRGDDDGFELAWGFGAQYTFSERLGLRAEWERFEDVDIDAWSISLNYKF
jgi:OOP family OmpA-OmpF porin